VSRNGGVLERAGHTEASVDISKLAKLNPSAVICEVMNEDGRMARFNDLVKFSKKHKLKIGSIEDLISFRLKNEKLIKKLSNRIINIKNFKNLELKIYSNKLDNALHYVIKKGKFNSKKTIRVRVISAKIDNSLLLHKNKIIIKSLNYLTKFNQFVLVVIKDQKSLEQKISEEIKVNNILRYYGIGAQIIKDLNIKNMILVSRSKKRFIGLEGFGIKIIKQEII
jgi:3,4-dihydroxy 2-butanone 4-phosphate synthase/GTP cyclohydrolase II